MGQRVGFYQSTNGKTLKENLYESYADFRNWILKNHKESVYWNTESIISVRLESFLTKTDKLGALDIYSQDIIDELTEEFLLTYCNYGLGEDKFELIDPCVYTRHYMPSFRAVEKVNDNDLKRLWSYLERGRSLKNSEPFIPIDEQRVVIGFWNRDEMQLLKKQLKELIQEIKKQENFVNKFFNKIMGTSVSEKIKGFELALFAFEEGDKNKIELIFYVE